MSTQGSTLSTNASRVPVSGTGQEQGPFRTACAQLIKELIWKCVRFRPNKPPICLYASRRSGSTLLMQMIGVNRGVMFSDQPFALYSIGSANINRLPIFSYSQVAGMDEDESAILQRYIARLLSGEIRVNGPWKFWSRDFHFFNDRICLKITDAKAAIDWIGQRFDVQTVVLTRHPIAQILSVASKGWLMTGKGLLNNRPFVERWLTSELEAMCWDAYRYGTELEWRTVDWALENLAPLSLLRDHPEWMFVSYEDLMTDTEPVVNYLADQLHLENRRGMLRQATKPSRSPGRTDRGGDGKSKSSRDVHQLVNGWREQISAGELRACFRILDRFGIQLYRPDSGRPDVRSIGRSEWLNSERADTLCPERGSR